MNIKQTIKLTSERLHAYKQLVGYTGTLWPQAFLLTLWSYFQIVELECRVHLLVEQEISCLKTIEFDQSYMVELSRVAVLKKEKVEFWTYLLTIGKGEEIYARCKSKIYVQCSESI